LRLLAKLPNAGRHLEGVAAEGFPTRELAEFYVQENCHSEIPERVMRHLRSMPMRVSRACPRVRCSSALLKQLFVLFGPFASWDADPYRLLGSDNWDDLIRAGAPLTWLRYADGAEHLHLLDAPDSRLAAKPVCAALRERGIDLARHRFCDGPHGCPCGYLRPAVFHEELQEVGPTPCSALVG
jgi:hypothetical protein